jgi:hypothetical protein
MNCPLDGEAYRGTRKMLKDVLLLGIVNAIAILALAKMLCYIRRGIKTLIFCVDRMH